MFTRNHSMMIRRLRRKFVMTAMGALLIMLILLLGFINVFYLVEMDTNASGIIQMLLDNGGVFPIEDFLPPPQDNEVAPPRSFLPSFENAYRVEVPFETRYFSVLVWEDHADSVDVEHIAAITAEQAAQYGMQVVSEDRTKGYYGAYKFGTQMHDDGSVLVVFIDCSSRFSSSVQLLEITMIIGGVALVLMFVIVYLLSGLAVAPAAQSLEKQKRFISDAGHELKTPLSVISANVDVLEIDGKQNEWTRSIRNQVRRMTDLVNNMLTLSRLEEGGAQNYYEDVDLSQCMQESAQTYTVVAVARERQYDIEIQPDIHMTGDRKSLAQLSSILLDNAMKYSSAGGTIRVQLFCVDRQIRYEVRNTCDELPAGDLDRLFDRFYREDTSRSRESGGYGIGLSVAKAICESHGGSITASREDDQVICFAARFPVL